MTRNQIEEFAVGYPYPTEYIEILLKKYDFDREKLKRFSVDHGKRLYKKFKMLL